MSFVEQLEAARSAILDRHADGPAKIVTVVRRPVDRAGQVARVERWRVAGSEREAISSEDMKTHAFAFDWDVELKVAGPEVLAVLAGSGLYVELSAEPE